MDGIQKIDTVTGGQVALNVSGDQVLNQYNYIYNSRAAATNQFTEWSIEVKFKNDMLINSSELINSLYYYLCKPNSYILKIICIGEPVSNNYEYLIKHKIIQFINNNLNKNTTKSKIHTFTNSIQFYEVLKYAENAEEEITLIYGVKNWLSGLNDLGKTNVWSGMKNIDLLYEYLDEENINHIINNSNNEKYNTINSFISGYSTTGVFPDLWSELSIHYHDAEYRIFNFYFLNVFNPKIKNDFEAFKKFILSNKIPSIMFEQMDGLKPNNIEDLLAIRATDGMHENCNQWQNLERDYHSSI